MNRQKKAPILNAFYITAIDNLPSILKRGILSHNATNEISDSVRIYDSEVVERRMQKTTPDGKSLWDFANFYFNPRNPMMYRVHLCEKRNVVVLKMKKKIFQDAKYISVGNAASSESKIVSYKDGIKTIQSDNIQRHLTAKSWGQGEGKRIIMSELLVPDGASPDYIDTIYVPQNEKGLEVRKKIRDVGMRVEVVPEPGLFFEHDRTCDLEGTQIKLIDGDMFFSKMQTLTISVNTVGAMGSGLAARAKFNFPQIYVKFQELCNEKRMSTKRPFLYKESYSYDEHMADDPSSLKEKPNDDKWFLLFATKEHWRYPSKIGYIRDGMEWLINNAAKEGIQSLATPALGCGLGGLPWEIVGPVMCQHLARLNIPCEIYLPRECRVPDEQLSVDFLLEKSNTLLIE